MNLDSIGFDLDGTLWNALEGVCGNWKEILSSFNLLRKVDWI